MTMTYPGTDPVKAPVYLEIWTHRPAVISYDSISSTKPYVPLVQKLRLTKACELALFGQISKYRDSIIPQLYWADYYEAIGIIDEEQTAMYNGHMTLKYDKPEKYLIKPGVVNVIFETTLWDIKLENI